MSSRKEYLQLLSHSPGGTSRTQYNRESIQSRYLNSDRALEQDLSKHLTRTLQKNQIYTQPFSFNDPHSENLEEKGKGSHSLRGELLYQKQLEMKLKRQISQLVARRHDGRLERSLTPRGKERDTLGLKDINTAEQNKGAFEQSIRANEDKYRREVSPSRVSNEVQSYIGQYKRKIEKYRCEKRELETVKRYLQSQNMRLVGELSKKVKQREEEVKAIQQHKLWREKTEKQLLSLKISQEQLRLNKLGFEEEITKLKNQGIFALNQWVQEKIHLQAQIKQLKGVESEKEICLSSTQKLQEELTRIKNEDIQELESKIRGLEEQNKCLEERSVDAARVIESKEREIGVLREENSRIREKEKLVYQIELDDAKKRVRESQEEKGLMELQMDTLRRSVETSEEEARRQSERMGQVVDQNESMGAQLEECKKTIKEQEFILSQQLREIYSIKQSKQQSDLLSQSLTLKLSQLQNNLKEPPPDNTQQYLLQIHTLLSQNQELKSRHTTLVQERDTSLQQANNEIQSRTKYYQQRQRGFMEEMERIRSFHVQQMGEAERESHREREILRLSVQDRNEEVQELLSLVEEYKARIDRMEGNQVGANEFTFNPQLNQVKTEEEYEESLFRRTTEEQSPSETQPQLQFSYEIQEDASQDIDS